mgnify:CR=1 FL=1
MDGFNLKETSYIRRSSFYCSISIRSKHGFTLRWWARSIDEEDDIKDEIDDFTNDVEGLLTGENTWDYFTNRWTLEEGLEDICPTMFLQMVYEANYLGLL